MRRFAGACRFVFNKAIAAQKERYESGLKYASHFDMCKWLPERKKAFPWLKDSPSHTLQKALKDVDRAYKNFFAGRAKFPRFNRKGMSDSFQVTNRTLMEPPYRGLMEPAEVGVFRVSDGVIFSCFSRF